MIVSQSVPIMPNESMASYVYRLCKANGLTLEIFTKIYMGMERTFAQLDAGMFDATRFCSCLPVTIRPDALLRNHTYSEIIKMFYDPENHNGSWVYEKYMGGLMENRLNIVKCPQCIEEDIKAGRPGYIHIEHCFPGANRCLKHNTPLFWYTKIETDESEIYQNWNLKYTRNNRNYVKFCADIQKRGAFADRTRLYTGLDAAVRMMKADELYINQAVINDEYTDTSLWDTRTGYRGYNNDKNPSFRYVKSIPEIMSTLLFLFRTPENVISYYSKDNFETPENKTALTLRHLTGDKYILKDITTVTDDDIAFTAIHTDCGCKKQFSINRFTMGERCACESMNDTDFLEYANQKADGFYKFTRSESIPGRFTSLDECMRYPFNHQVRDCDNAENLTKEYILQELNRPTLSTVFKILNGDKLYKETFDYIRDKEEIICKRVRKLKPGELFSDTDILAWSGFNQHRELFILNGQEKMINRLLRRAYNINLFQDHPGSECIYERI